MSRSLRLIFCPATVALLALVGCGGVVDPIDAPDEDVFSIVGDCPDNLPAGSGCIGSPLPPDAQPPEQGGCWVTGIGHIGSDTNGNGISDKPGAGKAEQDCLRNTRGLFPKAF